jgi:hypothetical protein
LIDDAGLRLTEATIPGGTNSPVLAIQDAVLVTWPFTDETFRLEESTDLTNWLPVLPRSLPVDGRNQTTLPADAAQKYFRLTAP